MTATTTPTAKAPRKSSVQPIRNASYADGTPLQVDGVFANVEQAHGAMVKLGLTVTVNGIEVPVYASVRPDPARRAELELICGGGQK